jgi:hypothetical protein
METLNGAILSYAFEFIGQEEKSGNMGFKDPEFDALIREKTTFQNGHAWCVYFCWLCWDLAYDDFNLPFQHIKEEMTGGAVRTYRHFRDMGWISRTPRVGSIAIWQKYKNGKATQSGHAAIVEKWDDNYIYTTDGNTNDKGGREGYVVANNKKRGLSFSKKKNGLVLKGFIIPKI